MCIWAERNGTSVQQLVAIDLFPKFPLAFDASLGQLQLRMGGYQPSSALDRYVAPGLRLWMLLALVLSILTVMVVIVCCFIRIRIPRTKRQIELIAARRRMRKQRSASNAQQQGQQGPEQPEDNPKGQTIVLNSLGNRRDEPRSKKQPDYQPLFSKSIPV
ncbi:hypothetical protein FO519_002197 [Halicephalobus sp. NKZ332]|nr:hypothetical protein FO519_002197 [Halicephalobus sp. NKZ332]